MYSQEIYIYFLWYSFTCTNLEIGPSAASLAWHMPDRSVSRFSRVAESPPWSWSSAGSPLSWNIHDAWERFGSQELLIERLLGRSTGTELTPVLPRALTHSQPPNTRACVPQEQHAVCSPGSVGLRLSLRHSSGGGGLLTPPVRPPGAEHPPPSSLKSKGAGLFNCGQEFLIQHGKGRIRREIQAVKTSVGSANRRDMMCFSWGAEKNKSASSGAHVRMRVRWCACTRPRACAPTRMPFPFLFECICYRFHSYFWKSEDVLT